MLCVWNNKNVVKVYRHMEILGIANIKVTLGKPELDQAVWHDLPGTLQSRESWFEVVTYGLKNLPGTQHNGTLSVWMYVWAENNYSDLIYTVACESLGTPCRICENVNSFNKIREIIQNACYFLFSTVLSKIFYIKYVYI